MCPFGSGGHVRASATVPWLIEPKIALHHWARSRNTGQRLVVWH